MPRKTPNQVPRGSTAEKEYPECPRDGCNNLIDPRIRDYCSECADDVYF